MKYIKQFIKITCICMIVLLIDSASIYAEELNISEDTTIESVIDGIVIIDDAAEAAIDVKEAILNNEEFIFYYDELSSKKESFIIPWYGILLILSFIGVVINKTTPIDSAWVFTFMLFFWVIITGFIHTYSPTTTTTTYEISAIGDSSIRFEENSLRIETQTEDGTSFIMYELDEIKEIIWLEDNSSTLKLKISEYGDVEYLKIPAILIATP